ncbi:MAG: BglI family type II restriction endonuclease [Muribaculaceae bacterium]|nr:BglI family type II restriction endonuclease [Muribaculaceae bacterium]
MFTKFIDNQFNHYQKAYAYYVSHPECLMNIERFIMNEIEHFIDMNSPDIINDYNEASYLYPFWKNYSPLDRGRDPKHDQFPWIEVGEQVFGNKLSRYFGRNYDVRDSGLPSGSDDRCIISSERIRSILGLTNSVWVFIDIKSEGPRDESQHAVMSPYQISGSGVWNIKEQGMRNGPIVAKGNRAKHKFFCSLSPIYVLSDGTIAPLVTFAIKPVYSMEKNSEDETIGQPLARIKLASIPNGILLTQNPNYLQQFPSLFFPGKDDAKKNPLKMRARVSFDILKKINDWRLTEFEIKNGILIRK